MAIRIIYLVVVFKQKWNLPKSSAAPLYGLFGRTYKAFVVTLLGVFALNMAQRFVRDLLGGANLGNKGRLWEMAPLTNGIIPWFVVGKVLGRTEGRAALLRWPDRCHRHRSGGFPPALRAAWRLLRPWRLPGPCIRLRGEPASRSQEPTKALAWRNMHLTKGQREKGRFGGKNGENGRS